ncbi:MAG TPA: hypothetical protein VFF37_06645 [Streptomyces sp.]|nr:hypothetical protein [Streptomyces sp.]
MIAHPVLLAAATGAIGSMLAGHVLWRRGAYAWGVAAAVISSAFAFVLIIGALLALGGGV